MIKKPKRSKYGNNKVEQDGIKFDSKKELKRYNELLLLQKAGEISDLQRQVKYELIPPIYEEVVVQLKTKEKVVKKSVQLAITYTADFVYKDKNGTIIANDVKASKFFQDNSYKIKKKLFRWRYGFDITETY